jgi:hypothetical protein
MHKVSSATWAQASAQVMVVVWVMAMAAELAAVVTHTSLVNALARTHNAITQLPM